MKLIDKSAVVAEIEKRIASINPLSQRVGVVGCSNTIKHLRGILSSINTLEVKEVDLEKEIKSFTEDLFHVVFDVDKSQDDFDWDDITLAIEDTAKHFFELGLKAQKGE